MHIVMRCRKLPHDFQRLIPTPIIYKAVLYFCPQRPNNRFHRMKEKWQRCFFIEAGNHNR